MDLKFRFRSFLPAIRIHVWGGFGSQLYASALKLDIENRFPSRRIRMLFHSSGVTSRLIEIENTEGSLIQVLDGDRRYYLSHSLRSMMKFLMHRTGLLSTCDTDAAWLSLKPWVMVIRGHYSYRMISSSTMREITLREIGLDIEDVQADSNLLIHYRIGDLATLDEKEYIKGERFESIFKRAHSPSNTKILVYTDSPSIAETELSPYSLNFKIVDKGPNQTLQDSIRAGFFIGTTAKLSYWTVTCREYFEIGPSALPFGHQIAIERTMGRIPEKIQLF